jgi:predicted amidohydrolase YtcJ
MDPEEMLEQALAASAAGFTLTIHAIGDRANHEVLRILGEVRRQESQTSNRIGKPLRHRIEHVQCIDAADVPQLARLGLLASVQPIHCTSDMLIADRYWGVGRSANAYAFRSLIDSGTPLVFGSDAPVEPFAPLMGIQAAVTRRRADGTPGPDGWHGGQRLAVAEAVDAYTRWPAYAAGEEDYRGSIEVGKVADLVAIGEDLFRIDPMTISQAPVLLTIIDGQIRWRAPAWS